MITKASVAGHPLHPILVPIPIGLWIFSLVCDFIYHATGNLNWDTVATYTLVGGIFGALLAALPGLYDLYRMPASQAKRVGLWHMGINLSLVTLYVLNYLWRRNLEPIEIGPVILSAISILVLLVSGWLGGEMVYRYGVGVIPAEDVKALHPEKERENIFGLKLHHRH